METQLLNDIDYDNLLNDIYSAAMIGDWRKSLKTILEATASNKVFFIILDIETNLPLAFDFVFNFEYDVDAFNYYLEDPTKDPFYEAIKHLPEGETYDIREYIDINKYVADDFHKRVLAPMKSHHVIGSTFIVDGKIDSRFALNRGPEDEPYSDQDLAFIQSLAPHYQKAVKIYNVLHDEKQKLKFNEAIVSQTDQALLLLDNRGEVLLQSEKMIGMTNKIPEFQIKSNRFFISNENETNRFNEQMKMCLLGNLDNKDNFLVISSKNTKRAYKLEFKLIKSSLFINQYDEDIVLVSFYANYSLDLVALEQEFELTHTELKVLSMYFEHHSLEDVATLLGSTKYTVRNHLQALYNKLNVNSQTKLMNKLRLFLR